MNCKPGDLAIVVRSCISSNVGKIVHVIGMYAIGHAPVILLDSERVVWLCETTGSELKWQSAHGVGFLSSTEGPIPDSCLRPIRPEADPSDHVVAFGESVVA